MKTENNKLKTGMHQEPPRGVHWLGILPDTEKKLLAEILPPRTLPLGGGGWR